MERAAVSAVTPAAVAFSDGLGERHQILDPAGTETLEVLCLREALATVPSFEFALRERVSRLANFRHANYGRVRSVERLIDRHTTLALISDCTPGVRLSELLARTAERHLNFDINTALCLLRQLVPAVAMLHEHGRDIPSLAHGAIGPERLVVTPNARLVIVEYAMGAALEQLRFSQERYWHELRIAVPRTAGLPRFDQRLDVTQLGIVALSLILGRLLGDDEYPARIGDVVASTWAVSARGGFEPLPPGLRGWLGRALQLETRTAFASAVEARAELDKILGDGDSLASPASLESFLARYHAAERRVSPDASAKSAAASASVTARVAPANVDPAAKATPAPVVASASPDGAARITSAAASAVAARPTTPPAPMAVPPSVPPAPRPSVTGQPPGLVAPPLPVVVTSVAEPVASNPLPTLTAHVPRPSRTIFSAPHHEATDHREVSVVDRSLSRLPGRSFGRAALAAALVALLGAGSFVGRRYLVSAPTEGTTGTLAIATNPSGAQAIVDGEPRGTTPLTLTLAAGSHTIELRGAGASRSIPVTIAPGMQASQYIELPKEGPTVGQLQIRTEPPGAQVIVDGTPRGVAPTIVADLAPGEHTVLLESDLGSVSQVVTIESGVTASLMVPLVASEEVPISGWIAVSAPLDVQIFENGRLLGTNLSDRIMVAAGRHEIELVNEALGYRLARTVEVGAGKVAAISVEVPKGTIALNAQPWAEVWIDGEKIGETPIGNLSLSIGTHDVVFRHPELGEQQHTVIVTLQSETRLSVDLRKQ